MVPRQQDFSDQRVKSFGIMQPELAYLYVEKLFVRTGRLDQECLCTLSGGVAESGEEMWPLAGIIGRRDLM